MGASSILFNGNDSYMDFDLFFTEPPSIPSPEKNIVVTAVEGRDGDLTEDLGTFKDIAVDVKFGLVSLTDLKHKCRQIKNWLLGEIIDKKLIFNDDLNYFYKVKSIKASDIEREIFAIGRFTVTFICEPFLFSLEGLNTKLLNSGAAIYNDGYYSKPVLKVYGTGDITLTFNNSIIYLKSIEDYITIDSIALEAYKDTDPINDQMDGVFPLLAPGINNIAWEGTVTEVEITPNYCYL